MSCERMLVGVDFRQPSLAAAKWAVANFGNTAAIELVHVYPRARIPGFLRPVVPPLDEFLGISVAGRLSGLRAFADTLDTDKVTTHVRVGDPVSQLSERARASSASFMVLGRTQESGARGRTLDRLIRGVNLPVVVIGKDAGHAPRQILVALDDAPVSAKLIRRAAILEERFDARLTLMHVLGDGVISVGEAPADRRVETRSIQLEVNLNRTHAWMKELYHKATGKPFRGRTTVAIGTAGPAILQHLRSAGANMVMVGRTGRHAAGGLGTVTRLLLRAAGMPVTVIPATAGPAPEKQPEVPPEAATDPAAIVYAEAEVFGTLPSVRM
ncbi:MAG: universal stress protein [Gemmatimonadota bacterium]